MTREEALRSVHEQAVTLLFDHNNLEALQKLDVATKVITRHVVDIYARRVKKGNHAGSNQLLHKKHVDLNP